LFPQEILKLISRLIENQNVNESERMKQKQSFYEFGHKCRCKEALLTRKKELEGGKKEESEKKKLVPVKATATLYPTPMNSKTTLMNSKTFSIEYDQKLSSIAKMMLRSFKDKYIYYAIDDILYFFKSKPFERDSILSLLYSPIISLQNTFSVDFFDIWIKEIYITETSKVNKFISKTNPNLEPFSSITITFGYKINLPSKKTESLW
jgi:hypothetical protein